MVNIQNGLTLVSNFVCSGLSRKFIKSFKIWIQEMRALINSNRIGLSFKRRVICWLANWFIVRSWPSIQPCWIWVRRKRSWWAGRLWKLIRFVSRREEIQWFEDYMWAFCCLCFLLVKELLSALYGNQVAGLLKYFRIFVEDEQRPHPPHPRNRKGKAQAQETRPKLQLLLHGRQVRRLQWDSRGFQPCPDNRGLQQL